MRDMHLDGERLGGRQDVGSCGQGHEVEHEHGVGVDVSRDAPAPVFCAAVGGEQACRFVLDVGELGVDVSSEPVVTA
ncbi:hypothetical protein J7E29_11965 [Streptomyces sp. ISL-90]|nr:hypothetical protein [Streptomyces sp. ISL-90]